MQEAINISTDVAADDPSVNLPDAVPEPLRAAALRLAQRYIWWEPPTRSLQNFPRFLAHTMNLATWEDQRWLETHIPFDHLLQALHAAPPGTFTRQSWNYWHVRLGKPAPPFPQKRIPT